MRARCAPGSQVATSLPTDVGVVFLVPWAAQDHVFLEPHVHNVKDDFRSLSFDRDVEWFGFSANPLCFEWSVDYNCLLLVPPGNPELVDELR